MAEGLIDLLVKSQLHYPPVPGVRIAREVAPDRVISVIDPDTRHAHKTRHCRQDGFKVHVVIEPDSGLITGTRLNGAIGPDNSGATVGMVLLTEDESVDTASPVEALGDSA